ncbi:type VI secretion system amidase immunity protein Tai4 [Pusillimonas sp. MFBS29]|uniref:T6SS amidase immunity protein Tai4 family protein n=1 Tax=Pusillimonas sp. MFBS29 TaxID=2886690 RepID=UPI001D127907|nr:T6SS amidase immunity protein Tai4 family protein [Pusillimonas sp. MFBS29]MCC2596368.1 type VI secretion system amidase immunity protein Tai4 [Pusillimonas sp. MFBS29]
MSQRWAALILMAGMLWGCAANGQKAADTAAQGQQAYTTQSDELEAQRLEKFAVSQCLMHAFPDNPVKADAGRASGGYVELGTSGPEVYEEIVSLVQAHRTKPYNSKSGESLFVMQCLDLLHDPALEALIRPAR